MTIGIERASQLMFLCLGQRAGTEGPERSYMRTIVSNWAVHTKSLFKHILNTKILETVITK